MSETSTLIGYSGWTIGREELTHRPIPGRLEMVSALGLTSSFTSYS
jgi:hypothetical protein